MMLAFLCVSLGGGFGDADPEEPEDFEFEVLDRKGYPADWLADKMDEDDEARILSEFKKYTEGKQG